MRLILFSLIVLQSLIGRGQSTDLPLGGWAYPAVEELEVRSGTIFHSARKPLSRRKVANLAAGVADSLGHTDRFDLNYLLLECREYVDSLQPNDRKFLGALYEYPSDFYSYHSADLDLHVNPIWAFGVGRENTFDDPLFFNYRGAEIRGTLDEKISFYTMLTENQARYPSYVNEVTDSTLAVPYEGFWKQYSNTGKDFLRAQAYFDINITKHLSGQFGYGKHFVGDGMRSMILSDFSNNYPYLRLETEVWRIQFTKIVAQLIGDLRGGTYGLNGTGSFPDKFLIFHRLGINIGKNLNIGLLESVITGRPDSTGADLKLSYLNPFIFYRALEQQDGSADNVLLGMDFKLNLWRKVQAYGQLVIDELMVKEVVNRSGWWGNKQAFQLGAKYFDALGIKDLNLQAEWNQARPYTYSHENLYTSYTHYRLPLAHPLGANFREVLLSASYRPLPRLRLQSRWAFSQYGNDLDSLNYGRDILKSYVNRPANREFGNDLLQGDQTLLLISQNTLTFHWKHNLLIDLDVIYRKETSEIVERGPASTIFALSFRWNFPSRTYLF